MIAYPNNQPLLLFSLHLLIRPPKKNPPAYTPIFIHTYKEGHRCAGVSFSFSKIPTTDKERTK